MSYCIATIDGNLTDDAKVIAIGEKNAVEISIAINFLVKGVKQASFFRVIWFDETEVKYLTDKGKKGAHISIVADVRTVQKDKTVYTNYTGIRVLQLYLADKKTASANAGITPAVPAKSPAPVKANPEADPYDAGLNDERDMF